MLSKEFQFYLDNQNKLASKYFGKYLIIKDCEVQGVYADNIVAYEEGLKNFGLGNFLLQHCLTGELSISTTFHSQVKFINE